MTSYSNLEPMTLDSLKAFADQFEKFRRSKSEVVVMIHASPSVVQELRDMTIPFVAANSIPDGEIQMRGVPIRTEHALANGAYAIEYADGHFEFHPAGE